MTEIRLYKSNWKALKILLLAIPFISIGIWMIVSDNSSIFDKVIGWFCVGFFGLAIPLFFYQLLDKRPQIIINEQGIFDRTAYRELINWNLIDNAYLRDVNNQKFICIIIKNEFKHLFSFRKTTKLSLAMGFQEININLSPIKAIDEQRLMEFILAMSKSESVDKQELMKELSNERKY